MNARILRKWSIHTKNLMSCSACSLVVVVLLLLPLLLVTCAATPALALAAMNLPQSQRTTTTTALHTLSSSSSSSLLWPTTSLALASIAAGVEKEKPMPKNVHHAAGAGEAIAAAAGGVGGVVRETLQASSNKQWPTLPWPTTIFASAAPATSLSYQQQQQQQQQPQSQLRREPTKLLASSSLQAYRSYGSGTRHQASQRLEVANNGGDIMAREPFPGFYTQQQQQQPRPDDIQPTWPLAARQYAKPTSSGSNNGGLLVPAWLAPKNKDILKPRTSQQMGEWARNPPKPLESHHHTEETDDVDDDDNMDDFMADKLGVDANNNYEEQEEEEDNDFDGDTDDDDDVENEDISQMTDNKYQDNKAATRLSGRNIKSLETRRHPYRQHYYQQQQQQKEQQHPSPTISHTQTKTPNIITKTTTTVFSSPNHKSMEPNIGSGGGDKVFDISNILKVNKIKSSAARAPIRFVIESYEVAPLPLSLSASTTASQRGEPAARRLKQLRSRHEQQQQAARNRRDSLRGGYNKRNQQDSSSPSSSSSMYFRHHHQHNNNHQRLRNKHDHRRRYCSARDPAQLAFEAPTVFEGKIVSMTPDRRMNFSATVEVREVFKQQIGYRLQKYLRLQFAYRNSSGECDIYREQLRPRGLVRGDTIEPGRIYLLFVQQLDIGNFTILGQPIRKTKRVVEAVRNAVSENYARFHKINISQQSDGGKRARAADCV